MKKLLIASCAAALAMSACQKEPSDEDSNSNPGGNTDNTKLVRIGTRVEDDSLTLNYSYNGLNRLSTLGASGTVVNGDPIDLQVQLNRNAANVITSAVLKSPLFIADGYETDNIVVNYKYDKVTSRYVSAAAHVTVDDEAQADSTVFNYDGTGKLTSMTVYFDDGTGYDHDLKIDYEYAGNNLATAKYYNFDENDNLVLIITQSFEYDSKPNPLQFADEAPALGVLSLYGMPLSAMETYYSANNGTKQTINDIDLQEPYVTTLTYSYNTANHPIMASGTDGGYFATLNYYYQ